MVNLEMLGQVTPSLTPEDLMQSLIALLPAMQNGVQSTPASVQQPEVTSHKKQTPIDKSLQEEWDNMRREPSTSGLNSTCEGLGGGANKAPAGIQSSQSAWMDLWASDEGKDTASFEVMKDASGRPRTVNLVPLQKTEEAKEFERGSQVIFDAKGVYSSGAAAKCSSRKRRPRFRSLGTLRRSRQQKQRKIQRRCLQHRLHWRSNKLTVCCSSRWHQKGEKERQRMDQLVFQPQSAQPCQNSSVKMVERLLVKMEKGMMWERTKVASL